MGPEQDNRNRPTPEDSPTPSSVFSDYHMNFRTIVENLSDVEGNLFGGEFCNDLDFVAREAIEREILEEFAGDLYKGSPVLRSGGDSELFTGDVLNLDAQDDIFAIVRKRMANK